MPLNWFHSITTRSRSANALNPVHYRKLISVFEVEGFAFARQSGDHLIYTRPGVKRPFVIPTYTPVPVFVIKNLIRTAGLTRERYFQLLRGA